MTSVLANVMHDNSEVEDLSFAALRYADGSAAEVTSSVVHHGEEQGIVLQCEKAKLAAPWSCVAEVTQANGLDVYKRQVRILNINEGHNAELMGRCRKLEEYAIFIGCVREFLKSTEPAEAIRKAMELCIEKGILAVFLSQKMCIRDR